MKRKLSIANEPPIENLNIEKHQNFSMDSQIQEILSNVDNEDTKEIVKLVADYLKNRMEDNIVRMLAIIGHNIDINYTRLSRNLNHENNSLEIKNKRLKALIESQGDIIILQTKAKDDLKRSNFHFQRTNSILIKENEELKQKLHELSIENLVMDKKYSKLIQNNEQLNCKLSESKNIQQYLSEEFSDAIVSNLIGSQEILDNSQ